MTLSLPSLAIGFITPFLLLLLAFLLSRQWQSLQRWYIGLRWTRWWAMGLLVYAMKHLPADAFHTQRGQGRLWISPKNDFFADTTTVR